ncbi:MAG TPA: hypothetical protein VKA84_06540 [Gemmatimonadaceae bacterium]|nr:hypothetical protein [Gemmatimonadaceae bacterium]
MSQHTRRAAALLAVTAALATAAACASSTPSATPASAKALEAPEARFPILVLAESATRILAFTSSASDSARVQARVASLTANSIDVTRDYVTRARTSALRAGNGAERAITTGDILGVRFAYARTTLHGNKQLDVRGPGYEHYWQLGRAKLELARTQTGQAVVVADSALACRAAPCASSRAKQMASHIDAAAGATREAEGLVRIALLRLQ